MSSSKLVNTASSEIFRKNKIAIVVSNITSTYSYLRPHLDRLSKFYDVTLLTKNDAPELLQDMKIPIKILEVPIERKIKLITDIKTFIILYIIFRRESFESVHTITPKAGLLGITASFFARTPIRIHTFQGEFWKNISGYSRIFFTFLDKIVAFLSTNILVVSKSERDFLIKEKILRMGQAKVLGDGTIGGVDLNRFLKDSKNRQSLRLKEGYLNNEIIFAYVGRLNREKGLNTLMDAFSRVFASNNNARLLIIGQDEDGTGEKLEKFSTKYASGVVNIFPFMRNPEKKLIVADILVLPSFREGFGLVIMEAAAMGIPSIGSNIYGISDAIQNGKTGLLFSVGDCNDLFSKMEKLLTNKEERIRLGDFAYNRVVKSFSQEMVLKQFVEYYKSLPYKQFKQAN